MTMAMSALQRMTDFKSVQLPLKSTGRNVIHHSLDLYMQSRSNVVRKDIVGLLLALIERGAVVQEEHDESPDIVTKALIIRELALASAFISAGHPKEVSSSLLRGEVSNIKDWVHSSHFPSLLLLMICCCYQGI